MTTATLTVLVLAILAVVAMRLTTKKKVAAHEKDTLSGVEQEVQRRCAEAKKLRIAENLITLWDDYLRPCADDARYGRKQSGWLIQISECSTSPPPLADVRFVERETIAAKIWGKDYRLKALHSKDFYTPDYPTHRPYERFWNRISLCFWEQDRIVFVATMETPWRSEEYESSSREDYSVKEIDSFIQGPWIGDVQNILGTLNSSRERTRRKVGAQIEETRMAELRKRFGL